MLSSRRCPCGPELCALASDHSTHAELHNRGCRRQRSDTFQYAKRRTRPPPGASSTVVRGTVDPAASASFCSTPATRPRSWASRAAPDDADAPQAAAGESGSESSLTWIVGPSVLVPSLENTELPHVRASRWGPVDGNSPRLGPVRTGERAGDRRTHRRGNGRSRFGRTVAAVGVGPRTRRRASTRVGCRRPRESARSPRSRARER